MKLRPVLFEFDIPNLRSDRQTKTVRTIAKIIREGILDREPIKKYINETQLDRQLQYHECLELSLIHI